MIEKPTIIDRVHYRIINPKTGKPRWESPFGRGAWIWLRDTVVILVVVTAVLAVIATLTAGR